MNAGTLQPYLNSNLGTGPAIAPGALISIFGQNLCTSAPQAATGFPLPRQLAGSSVTINGLAMPLLYVSPTQINAQMPTTLGAPYSLITAGVVVHTQNGDSPPQIVELSQPFPGLFSANGSGCGQAAVLFTSDNSPVTSNHSAQPGDTLALFLTGLGPAVDSVGHLAIPDGQPAPTADGTTLYLYYDGQAVAVGDRAARVMFVGKAPGLVGVDQLNFTLPADVQQGCAVPLTLTGRNSSTQTLTLPIHSGGGPCVDTPPVAQGDIQLTRTITMTAAGTDVQDSLQNSFLAAESKRRASPALSADYNGCECTYSPSTPSPGPACADLASNAFTDHPIDAGPLTFAAFDANGQARYTATTASNNALQLPANTLNPDSLYRVSSTGSASVAPWAASIAIPAPITLAPEIKPGSVLPIFPYGHSYHWVEFDWTGGDPLSTVRLEADLFESSQVQPVYHCSCAAKASAEHFRLIIFPNLQLPPVTLQLRLAFTNSSEGVREQPFSPLGLPVGGFLNWAYQFNISGLVASSN